MVYDLFEKKSFVLHQEKHPITSLTISSSKNFIYGMLDKTPDEQILVWNLTTRKKVHQHELDIEDDKEI